MVLERMATTRGALTAASGKQKARSASHLGSGAFIKQAERVGESDQKGCVAVPQG